jgi:hypothetical protein
VNVPAYGPDDNELGTLPLPSVSVPTATYTSWNLRHRSVGAENELLSLSGGYIAFGRTAKERQAAGDPRPALLERYRDFDDYRAQFMEAARRLASERYVLDEEMAHFEAEAAARRPQFDRLDQSGK